MTAALGHTGLDDAPSFSLYHQVFNRARWSAPGLSPGQALEGRLVVRRSAWYAKQQATFSDALASVRRHLWEAE